MIAFLLSVVVLWIGIMLLGLIGDFLTGQETVTLWGCTPILGVILGSALFPWWGWKSTLGILAIIATWTVIGAILERRDRRKQAP